MKRETEMMIFFGRVVMEGGLVMGSSGNMSMKKGNRIYITRTGAMLGYLSEHDIIDVGLNPKKSEMAIASKELKLHLLIYEWRKCGAVLHTHPPYTLAVSGNKKFIKPVDLEGRVLAPEIPVISLSYPYKDEELNERLKPLLKKYPYFVVRWHGLFATGDTLEEAVKISFTIESSSKLLFLLSEKT
jgi:L-fuculose-phosphate aldolase